MKFRLTPLNIITALGFALLIASFFQPETRGRGQVNVSGFYKWLLAALIVVTFISDLIFRFALKKLQRIWIVEMLFIIATAILILILQK